MKLPRSPTQRNTIVRQMTPNAAGGRTAVVSPEPRPLAPLGTVNPAISAAGVLYLDSVNAIPHNVLTQLVLDADGVDIGIDSTTPTATGVVLDKTNGWIVVAEPGTYHVGGVVRWYLDPNGWREMQIRRNRPSVPSDWIIASDIRPVTTEADFSDQSCSGLVNCLSGDQLRIHVRHANSDGADDLDVTGGGFTHLWAFRIGDFGR